MILEYFFKILPEILKNVKIKLRRTLNKRGGRKMGEKVREYLSRPDRVNLSILIFGATAYFISWCLEDSKQGMITSMSVILFLGALLFAYVFSVYTVMVFLSSISLNLFLSRDIALWNVSFLIITLILNPVFMIIYLDRTNYIKQDYVLSFNDFIKMFIFSNISPVIISSFVMIQTMESFRLFFMILAFALVANFYFWHNIVYDPNHDLEF